MRNTIFALIVVFIVSLLGIIGWHVVRTNQYKAELAQYESEAASRKPVKVEIAVIPPPNTPKDQPLYISGSVPALGNWDAAGVPLKPGPDGKHHAQIDALLNGMEYAFKVTRGTWSTVETDPNGKDVNNRVFTASANTVIDAPVANWIDGGKAVPGRVTMTGEIRFNKKFHSDVLGNDRTLIVYLPPGYDKAKDKYPVLYMQDGQNLFDESTSYQGIEWKLDETAQQLITDNKISPLIIVGIYNSETRTAEFTPNSLAGKTPAQGDQYAKLVASEVKPFIDSHYRTMPDRDHTAIGGASQGALISMYVARQNPTIFGKLLLMSPWMHLNGKPVLNDWLGDEKWLKGTKVYVEMGTEPGDNYPTTDPIADAQPLASALEKAGLTRAKDFDYREIEGGRHNESAWANTVSQPLLFLFGQQSVATNKE
jgi:enterochelin esterase-like enzyme